MTKQSILGYGKRKLPEFFQELFTILFVDNCKDDNIFRYVRSDVNSGHQIAHADNLFS